MSSTALAFPNYSTQQKYADVIAQSTLVPEVYRGKSSNVFLAIEWGKALGLSPIEAMNGIDIIQGKPTLSVETMAALARAAGHTILPKELPGTGAECTIILKERPNDPLTFTFTLQDAERMGLTNKDNWKKQPGTMCMWRAISKAIRFACPEVLHGISYTPEEQTNSIPAQQADEQKRPTPVRGGYGNTQPTAPPAEHVDVEVNSIDVDETTGELYDDEEDDL